MRAVSFLASNSDDILWNKLSELFQAAEVVRIASAFLGAEGELVSWLDNNVQRRAEILVRLEYPTNPTTVAALVRHPRVTIRAADSSKITFHEKFFLVCNSAHQPTGAYIGSANWTTGGLRKNVEAGVWISEPSVLMEMREHFEASFREALPISDQMLSELRSDFLWHASHGKRPRKDRGTLISSWPDLRAADDGFFLIKQNGLGSEPFIEGEDFYEIIRNQSSQTLSKIPSTFEQGLGVIVSLIARRRDGSPDRLIYGRGRIAGFDERRWRLPEKYLVALARRGIEKRRIDRIRQWPYIVWLDPAEYINYPPKCTEYLWLSDYMAPSFQGGYRWLSPEVWKACNQALDKYTGRFGVLPVDRQGIWWNQHVGITDTTDPIFLTKARIEEMNLSGE